MTPAAGPETGAGGTAFRAFVASRLGITVIEVEAEEVVGYALVHDGSVADVAETPAGSIAAASPNGVLVGDAEEFENTGFSSVVAVGGDPLLAADAKGKIARRTADGWTVIDSVPETVNAIDGDLIATDAGVYQLAEDRVKHVGLEGAADVSAVAVPHAATASGLYKLGAGWMHQADGAFHIVGADQPTAEPGVLERAHAATEDQLFVFDGEAWGPWHIPVAAPIRGIGYADAVYAVSEDGTLITAKGGEWRTRSLGVSGVTGLVVQPMEENA